MAKAKKSTKKKSGKKAKAKVVKNHRAEVSYKETSDLKSDEPSVEEGDVETEFENESDREEEEEDEGKNL